MSQPFAIGSNGSGQLGIGHKEDVSVPKPVIFPFEKQGFSTIRAGGNHTLLLTNAGSLYCSGDYTSGACGLSPPSRGQPGFREHDSGTEDFGKVLFCAATWEASVIVREDEDGRAKKVYSFGTGNKGELGLGEMIFRSPKSQLIERFPPGDTEIVDLSASMSHVVAVLSNGEVYGWGSGRKGQIGQPEKIVHEPRLIGGIGFKVVRAVCGRENSTFLGAPNEGRCVVFGSDKASIQTLAPPILRGWKDVGGSWGSVFVLMSDGSIACWGRDDHGQLAAGNLPKLSQIAVGSEHVVGLTKDGEVMAWGWGEHGNCGPVTDANGDVKGKWNVIASSKYLPDNSKIVTIGAGCATSWICVDG